jgi:hypothetical protein
VLSQTWLKRIRFLTQIKKPLMCGPEKETFGKLVEAADNLRFGRRGDNYELKNEG